MSRFKPYPEYKDSGVEWLGEVPVRWEVVPLKRLADICNGRDYTGVEDPEGKYRVFGSGGEFARANNYLYDGESVLLGRKGTVDKPLHVQGRFWTVDTMFYTVVQEAVSARYLYYSALTIPFRYYSTNTALPSMTQESLGSHLVAAPAFLDQVKIARFLDHETARIDALIAEQERLIDLLKEKRQAVISHVITKGLNPDAPMKDSGVEWLGEVPAHWDVVRVKHVIQSIEQGWSPQCDSFPVESESEWGVLKVGCVNGGVFNSQENKRLPAESEPIPALGIRKFDLLISRANIRELVGSAAVALDDFPNLMLCDKLYRMCIEPSKSTSQFLAFYLGSSPVRRQIELMATGASSSMLNIGQSVILDLAFPRAPLEEQKLICSHIEEQLAQIEAISTTSQTTRDLLQERRAALISAAVTGKIDLRNWQPPAHVDTQSTVDPNTTTEPA